MTNSESFCVYEHARPDGRVFYIGKGTKSRAYELSPSRRNAWHANIVAKYGRGNIILTLLPCRSESEAFDLERARIEMARAGGANIANLTDGGEGASGRAITSAQAAGLEKGRQKGKKGRAGARPELAAWKLTEAGIAHMKALGAAGKARLHAERQVACCECGQAFITRSAKAKACSRRCEQRHRRAREKSID